MHNIGLDLLELLANRPDTPLIACAEPADLRDVQAVEPDVICELIWRAHWPPQAGKHMDLNLRPSRESLQQRFWRSTKGGNKLLIILRLLSIIGGQNNDSHVFWKTRLWPTCSSSRKRVRSISAATRDGPGWPPDAKIGGLKLVVKPESSS